MASTNLKANKKESLTEQNLESKTLMGHSTARLMASKILKEIGKEEPKEEPKQMVLAIGMAPSKEKVIQ